MVMNRPYLTGAVAAVFASLFATTLWASDGPPQASEGEAAAQQAAMASAESPANEEAAEKAYKPPPGFKTKQRNGETKYCRNRASLGTRIKSEECFTQAEMAEVERAMREVTEDIGQRGRMCTSGRMCSGG